MVNIVNYHINLKKNKKEIITHVSFELKGDDWEDAKDDFQQELLDDVVSIIHHFSMKLYSNRRAILKNTNGLLKSTKKD